MNLNELHKRLTMWETAIKEMKLLVEKELTPPPPRKRRNLKQERVDKYRERYEFGTKKNAPSKPTKQAK